jgi:VWFA-related protein
MPRTRICALFLCYLFPFAVHGQAASGTPAAIQPAPASAQPAPGVPAAGVATAGSPAGGIHLDIVVTDHSGKPMPGLTAADFTVLDNNQPAKIASFHAYGPSPDASDAPVQAIIVFDTVNTAFDTVSYTRQQVVNFLRQNGGHLPLPISLLWLTNTGIVPQGQPTLDGNELATSLEGAQSRLRTLTRAAGAYGAIEQFELSSRLLSELVRNMASLPGRKLLIWAGPGWPMLDGPNINISAKGQQALFAEIVELSTEMRQAQVDLYSISQGMPGADTFLYQSFLKGVKKVNQASIPNLGLKVIAVQSGGFVLPPSNDVATSLDTCVRDAGPYYSITFEPPPADGPNEYHKLDVRVNQAGLTARTNTGYYNQPAGAEDKPVAGR